MNAPGLLPASVQIADLGWRQLLRSKLLVGLGLLVVAPAIMAGIIHAYARGSSAPQDYQAMQAIVLSVVVVPLVSLLLGTAALASEREGGTLAYLFTRPVPRAAVVVGKGAVAMGAAVVVTVLATLATWIASGAPDAQMPGGVAALSLQAFAMTGAFVFLGTVLARGLYLGLAYVVLVEGLLGNVPIARGGWTIGSHARNLLSSWSSRSIPDPEMLVALPGGAAQSVLALLLVGVAGILAACVWVERREYGLKDRPKEE
ncbi:MAG TPA: ABC transporter permease subunit [Candidatus Thermoplasmatota archaeon]|nr:ABC transporter permease subunit [Candidatus Thermoplasmatota archaeon]